MNELLTYSSFSLGILVALLFAFLPISVLKAQSGKILHEIQKLEKVGTVLYVAAHPDDENTRLISYLSNHEKLNTVYLSLTRGDGGQNLIGSEIREKLGLIRTHELLQARSVDGGSQFFSRANDFGYSKTPEETMKIWDKEEVLADVVWAIRVHQPDVIVNRFNHDHNGRTHGHHTASAMLSFEAFDLAGDPTAFPEQLEYVAPWQPQRIYFNTSWWFYGSREKFAEADKSDMAEVNVGQYYPLLGQSNNEISAASRSMHKCQGFGSATGRGNYYEYLQFLKGIRPEDKDNVTDGINTSWARLPGGGKIQNIISTVVEEFDPVAPHNSIPNLLEARDLISQLDHRYWKDVKLNQIDKIIMDCAGVFARAEYGKPNVSAGDSIDWQLEVINRSPVEMSLKSVHCPAMDLDSTLDLSMDNNEENILSFSVALGNLESSSPYWLKEPGSLGMYTVKNQLDRGKPLGENQLTVRATLTIEDQLISLELPLSHVRVDPVKGELNDPVQVTPEVYLNFTTTNTVFKPNETKRLSIEIKSNTTVESSSLTFQNTEDWLIQYDSLLPPMGENEIITVHVDITAPGLPSEEKLVAEIRTPTGTYATGIAAIKYDHIPGQQIEEKATTQLICSDIRTMGSRIGYIQGAGDDVDEALRQIGFLVDLLDPNQLNVDGLKKYDAILLGIRAFNTKEELAYQNKVLFEYVEQGGNLIVQYNTRHRLKTDEIGPYPLTLSRKRVTDETSPVRILVPEHQVMNFPNQLSLSDFDGWVQERGLYFPDEWDDNYTPILAMSDPGEDELQGALLIAEYGQGNYIYTPLSYFRQFPSGVTGAYRLMANMIALGKNERP